MRESTHRMSPGGVHVDIWASGSEDERRQLLSVTGLRSHPDDRVAYEAAKRTLAGRWRDVNYYARAKGPFIDRVVERARPTPGEG